MGHDTAQSIIDQIVQSHESGGRAQMFAAPSMRIGAGFMNPMATARESLYITLITPSKRLGCIRWVGSDGRDQMDGEIGRAG